MDKVKIDSRYRLRGYAAGMPYLDGLAVKIVPPSAMMPSGFARCVALDDPEGYARYTVPLRALGPLD